jgi:hypothetical protein
MAIVLQLVAISLTALASAIFFDDKMNTNNALFSARQSTRETRSASGIRDQIPLHQSS